MMTRETVNELLKMKEKVRYLPGLRTFIGFKQGYVEFVRDDRFEGNPKMSFRKLFMLATDAIFSFSKFPLRLCLILGTTGTVVFYACRHLRAYCKSLRFCYNWLVFNFA